MSFVVGVYNKTKSHWFLNAYAVLMLFAPILNRGLASIERRDLPLVVFPMLILALGWSWAAVKFQRFISLPCPSGFGSYTFLMMIGVYVAARVCRIFDVAAMLKLRTVVMILLASGLLVGMGGGHYASPFATVFAGSLFFLFRRMEAGLAKFRLVWHFCAPSMFAVYLFHAESQGIAFIRGAERFLAGEYGLPPACYFMVIALSMFFCGMLLDIGLRRTIEKAVRRAVKVMGQMR